MTPAPTLHGGPLEGEPSSTAPGSAAPDTETSGSPGRPRLGPLASGSVAARHVLLQRLGAGAMGEVWAACDPRPDRRIALELVRPEARSLTVTVTVCSGEVTGPQGDRLR